MIDKIIAYEEGTLDDEDIIDLFQTLIDTGQAWTLQGSYGRMAASLIEAGQCRPAPAAFEVVEPETTPTQRSCALVSGCDLPGAYSAWDQARRTWVRGCRYHIAALDL
jgi:hypothetical protein